MQWCPSWRVRAQDHCVMPSRSPNANRPVGAHGVATATSGQVGPGPPWPKLSATTSRSTINAVEPHCALHSGLDAHPSSRPLPRHRSKLICATCTESLIRRVPTRPCFGRMASLLACLKASRRSLNWQSIRDLPDVRHVFLERHTSEEGVLRAFRSVVLRATHLTLKQTLGDHRIPPNSCAPLTSCKLAIFSPFLESFRTRAVSNNA